MSKGESETVTWFQYDTVPAEVDTTRGWCANNGIDANYW